MSMEVFYWRGEPVFEKGRVNLLIFQGTENGQDRQRRAVNPGIKEVRRESIEVSLEAVLQKRLDHKGPAMVGFGGFLRSFSFHGPGDRPQRINKTPSYRELFVATLCF